MGTRTAPRGGVGPLAWFCLALWISTAPAWAEQTESGELYVHSTPEGAAIVLGGVDTGRVTPTVLRNIATGEHELLLRHGCLVARDTIEVRPKLVARSELTLAMGTGQLRVETSPQGATLTLDDEARGVTPLLLEALPCGEYDMAVELPGHVPIQQRLIVEPYEERSMVYELPAQRYGTLVVIPDPVDAEVVVDGASAGHGALTL